VTTALWGIAQTHPEETVAVVSHGGPIALFCQAVLNLPYRRPMPFSINNCSLNVFEASISPSGERQALLLSLNDVCHLND
jgi:broad specificity phosphatase PhoE